MTPPYKVLVRSGHNVGKSFIAACLVNWFYDCFDPGVVLTTAPNARQVQSILWKEVRLLRRRAGMGGFDGPKIARMSSAPNHFAEGFTARDGTRFQGQHDAAVMIVFDEAEGVEPIFWEAAETMLGGHRYCFLALFNPTQQAGPTVDAERQSDWKTVAMSCVDHPNIRAELDGKPPPVPNAIRLGRLREMLRKWSDVLAREDDPEPGDVELAPGERYRPRAIAQCRLLGIRPSTAFDEVWSEALWQKVCGYRREINPDWPVQIGCDVAWYGDDYTSIHVRQGMCSLHHESHNGWSPDKVAGRLKQLAQRFAGKWVARRIPILVDLIGMGGGVVSHRANYNFVPVSVTDKARNEEDYDGLRTELWFSAAEIGRDRRGLMDVSRLDDASRDEIGRQLRAVKYQIDHAGRQKVEDKDATKKRIGRSPDDADGFNLAWLPYVPVNDRIVGNF